MFNRDQIYAKPCPEDPEEEFAARKLARNRLLHFTHYTFPDYFIDSLQLVLAYQLERVLNDEIDRLMVFAPPQHGKSELVSIRFPSFWFAHRPDAPIILCSYGSGHAYDKVFAVRQVIESLQYRILFPKIAIAGTTRGGSNWRIRNHKAIMVSAGVGGPITGYGALLGIIDDPFKNYQEAESVLIRERIWNWYTTTFRTRIWEKGKIILVMTRWHEDDLAGRLLNEQHEKWEVVRLPAIAETQEVWDKTSEYLGLTEQIGMQDPAGRQPGEPLCPSRFSMEALMSLRADVGPIAWSGQYGGSPRMPEGNIIKRSWFKLITLPELMEILQHLTLVRYWDKAANEGEGARTAGVLIGRDTINRYIVIDVVKGQWSTHKRDTIILETAERDRKAFGNRVEIYLEQEPGSGGLDSARATMTVLAGFSVHKDSPSGSKLARLGPFMGQAEAGNIYMVKAPWNFDYLEELTAIPLGAFWDQADATSGAFNKLARSGWSRAPRG